MHEAGFPSIGAGDTRAGRHSADPEARHQGNGRRLNGAPGAINVAPTTMQLSEIFVRRLH
jgi:hypothetical protein